MVQKQCGDEPVGKKPRGKEFIIKRGGKKVLANTAPVKTKIKDKRQPDETKLTCKKRGVA